MIQSKRSKRRNRHKIKTNKDIEFSIFSYFFWDNLSKKVRNEYNKAVWNNLINLFDDTNDE